MSYKLISCPPCFDLDATLTSAEIQLGSGSGIVRVVAQSQACDTHAVFVSLFDRHWFVDGTTDGIEWEDAVVIAAGLAIASNVEGNEPFAEVVE